MILANRGILIPLVNVPLEYNRFCHNSGVTWWGVVVENYHDSLAFLNILPRKEEKKFLQISLLLIHTTALLFQTYQSPNLIK